MAAIENTAGELADVETVSTIVGTSNEQGGTAREIDLKPGEKWTQKHYVEMNLRYQRQTLEQLEELATGDTPFFLQYWPLYPLVGPRTTTAEYTTPNGGTYVEKMKLVDSWIGDLMAEMDSLGIAENTIVIVMGDNGHFTKYSPQSGYTPMIFRGGKGDKTEGGVRVDAFVRWPGMIEADSVEFIKEYIVKGKGISFLYEPEIRLEAGLGLLRKIPIKGGPLFVMTDIAYSSEVDLSPPAQMFLRLMEEKGG